MESVLLALATVLGPLFHALGHFDSLRSVGVVWAYGWAAPAFWCARNLRKRQIILVIAAGNIVAGIALILASLVIE